MNFNPYIYISFLAHFQDIQYMRFGHLFLFLQETSNLTYKSVNMVEWHRQSAHY